MMPTPTEFVYVDTAFGGVNHRNHVKRVDEVVVNGVADCYTSYQRATDALPAWVSSHTNDRGNPTVAGFDGATWAPRAVLDLDHRTDPGVALGWARQVDDKLAALGVPPRAIRRYFSGCKGFHLEIAGGVFGGFTPSAELHSYLRRLAELLLGDIPFDTSVYDKLRLWRLPNSRHSKTGLYKIQLTRAELHTLDIGAIQRLAVRPRDMAAIPELVPVPDDDWHPVDALVDLWQEAQRPAPAVTPPPRPVSDSERDRQTIGAIVAGWPHGGLDEGQPSRHTEYLLPISGFLARRGLSIDEIARLLKAAADTANDQNFLKGRDWKGEIDRLAATSVSKAAADQKLYGLPALAAQFPALAAVLGALWPSPTLEPGVARSSASTTVLPFPVDALPPAFRALVGEGAAALCAPPDFLAVPLLVATGVAVGNAVQLEIKSGWCESGNISAAIVGNPGSKKSPAMALATRPLQRIQQRLADDHARASERYEGELARWEGARKQDRGAKPKPPPFSHLLTTDATTEALAPMLLASKGVLLLRDELTGWVRSMDQYRSGRGADRQHYLSIWSRTPLKIDRKTAPPIVVPRPFLGIVGGIQPDLLPELGNSAQREDGFPDRLVWSFPEGLPDQFTEACIAPATEAAVEATFERLYALQGDYLLRFSPAAAALWRAWYDAHAAELAVDTFPARLQGPWAKMPAQLARLTVILHALTVPLTMEVTAETLGHAADLVDYFKSHAKKVYSQLGRQHRGLSLRVLQALKERGEVPQHVLTREVFHGNVPAEQIRAALAELEEAGLAAHRVLPTEGRPVTLWRAL
jgi:hypothetical protein